MYSSLPLSFFLYNKGSTELTAKALPEIVKLLQQPNGGDSTTVSEAAKLMNDLTKKEASCKAVISNAHVVRTMIQAMVSTQSLDVQKSLAGGIHNISSDRLDWNTCTCTCTCTHACVSVESQHTQDE